MSVTGSKRMCAIKGCTQHHPRRHLLCRTHWRMVPRELKERVWSTARRMWDGEPGALDEWMEARQEAIAAVEQAEADREAAA